MTKQAIAVEQVSWLDRVRMLGPMIDAAAAANEQATELTPEVVQALDDAGIFSMSSPRELGGGEAHPTEIIDVLSELSYWDGSTGWYCMVVMSSGSFAGACLGPKAVAAMFAEDFAGRIRSFDTAAVPSYVDIVWKRRAAGHSETATPPGTRCSGEAARSGTGFDGPACQFSHVTSPASHPFGARSNTTAGASRRSNSPRRRRGRTSSSCNRRRWNCRDRSLAG